MESSLLWRVLYFLIHTRKIYIYIYIIIQLEEINILPLSFDRPRINTFITKMIKNKLCEENIKTAL